MRTGKKNACVIWDKLIGTPFCVWYKDDVQVCIHSENLLAYSTRITISVLLQVVRINWTKHSFTACQSHFAVILEPVTVVPRIPQITCVYMILTAIYFLGSQCQVEPASCYQLQNVHLPFTHYSSSQGKHTVVHVHEMYSDTPKHTAHTDFKNLQRKENWISTRLPGRHENTDKMHFLHWVFKSSKNTPKISRTEAAGRILAPVQGKLALR